MQKLTDGELRKELEKIQINSKDMHNKGRDVTENESPKYL